MLEIGNQFLGRRESVDIFNPANVSVIAFTHLVVVTENAFAMDNVGEPILEGMSGSLCWPG
jgi:hypothetical protein